MKTQNNISKKLLAGLLSSSMILGASGTTGIPLGLNAIAEPADSDEPAVQAEQGPIGGKFCDWELEDGSKPFADNTTSWHYEDNVLTISGTGDMPDFPWDLVEKRPWYGFKTQIKKIVIEDGVTSIGGFAFIDLWNNLSVEIGKDVEKICYNAFQTTALTEVIIPENVKEIEAEAFKNCWQLESVICSDTITIDSTPGKYSFLDCPKFTSTTSPEIFSGNFRDWTVEGEKPFADSDLSWSYDITTHTLTISGTGAMPDWEREGENKTNPERPWQSFRRHITNIVIDDGVTSIGKYAFSDVFCHDNFGYVLEVEIGKDVKEICEGAFYNTCLTDVFIPETVEEIHDKAFYDNWELKSVLLTYKTSVAKSAFDGQSASATLTRVGSFGGKFSDWEVTLTKDESGNNITPKTVNPFPEYNKVSWSYEPKTGTLTISGEGPMPDWVGGSEDYVKENTADHWQNRPWQDFQDNVKAIIIDNGVTHIGKYAFCNFGRNRYKGIELDVQIPNSVESIGKNAFYTCYHLKNLTIPDSVTTIEQETFWNCKYLESIELSENLTKLNNYVFCNCHSLKSIVIPNTVTEIETHAFDNCKSLTNVVIPENVNSIGKWAFAGCDNLAVVEFEGTTTIPELKFDVFIGCPCVENGNKGLIIKSCKYLDQYIARKGWGVTIYNSKDDWRDGKNNTDFVCDYMNNINKTHDITYTASGAVITEKCHADGCGHTATAELSVGGPYTYTGNPFNDVVTNTYSDNWAGTGDQRPGDIKIKYENNTKVGTATAKLTILNDDGMEATSEINFKIIPSTTYNITATSYNGEYDGQEHSIIVNLPNGISINDVKITYGTDPQNVTSETNPKYTNVGNNTVYYKVEIPDGRVITGSSTVTITPKVITDSMVTVTPDPKGGKPTVTVKDGGTTLKENTDYTVVISGPTKNPTTGENKYEVKVTGKGNYKDSVTKPVYIIDSDGWSGMYDGKGHSITVKGYPTGSTIKYGTTSDTYDLDSNPSYTDKGDYTVYYQVTMPNGQVETGSATVKITAKPITGNMVTVTYDPDKPDTPPTVTVTDGGKELIPGTDYNIDGPTKDTETGETKYKVTVTGTGNYTDEVEKTIPEETGGINAVSSEGWSGTYDGSPRSITVKDIPAGAEVTYLQSDGTYGPTKPTHTDVGTYTDYYRVELNGKKITGSDTVVIKQKPITAPTVTVNVTTDSNDPDTPKVTVKDGGKDLKEDEDYTVTVDPGTGKVTITGTGNYTGSRVEIIPKNPDTTNPGGTNPGGTNPGGTNPGSDPGNNPGSDPGNNPGSDPGNNPGSDPGNNPGGDPGNNPGSDPGNNPGSNPGSNPGGSVEITVDGWNGEYDGDDHSITVNNIPEGSTVTYGTKDGEYDSTDKPTYTDVGENTVYYKVELPDGQVITGTAKVEITPKPVTNPTVTVEVVANPDNPDNPKVTVKDGDKILTLNVDYTVLVDKTENPDNGEPDYKVTIVGKGNYGDKIGEPISVGTNGSPNGNPNPNTGNSTGPWTWILLSVTAATGISVTKVKSKRKMK